MSEEPQAWTLWGPSGPEPECWSWSLLVPGKYGRYSVSLCVDDPGEGGDAVQRIVRACRAHDDLLAACQMAAQVMAYIGLGGDLKDTDDIIMAKATAAFDACNTAIAKAEEEKT